MRLKDKVAIVTGAGQTAGETVGNGRATAIMFALHGAKVFLTDIDEQSLAETRQLIANEGGDASSLVMDVSQEADCERMVDLCLKHYGRLDILHNNVGIGQGDSNILYLEASDWQRIMDVNLTSMFYTCKHALKPMRDAGSGSIINISSVAAIAATNMLAYKTSKAGVMALTEHVAMNNAKYGVRANCILPGLMNTPMAIEGFSKQKNLPRETVIENRDKRVPLRGKMGTAWDVAHAALFLASDEANFITGVNLPVDGGQSIRIG